MSCFEGVSVVMAVHNGSRFLRQQVQSILQQLLAQDELIVVDDASNDDSIALLMSLDEPRIKIHRNEHNVGVIGTFERGLSLATRDIIFLSDQDDVWMPQKRAACIAAFARDPEVVLVITDAQVIDDEGKLLAPSFMATRGGFRGSVWSTILRNRYLGCAMVIHRKLLRVALPMPRDIPMHDMWLGALASKAGRVTYVPLALLQYRRHGGNVSPSQRQSVTRMLAWRWSLLTCVLRRRAATMLRLRS
jgi:glycosyltransferase involved in cell wall biosynthesis